MHAWLVLCHSESKHCGLAGGVGGGWVGQPSLVSVLGQVRLVTHQQAGYETPHLLGEAVLLGHQKIPLRSADCQNKNFIAIVIHGMQDKGD